MNYKGTAIRIDGGPAMANMDGFLTALEGSMKTTLTDGSKQDRFIKSVIENGSDYANAGEVVDDLEGWSKKIAAYKW